RHTSGSRTQCQMSHSTPLPHMPPRSADSHKGDFGRALLIGGSRGMAGSISLSGMACLRSGVGLLQLATPHGIQSTVARFEPSYMTIGLPEDADGRIAGEAKSMLAEHVKPVTAIACGPGLGRSSALTGLVVWLYQHVTQPMVVDADGLNALATQPNALTHP